MNPEKLARLQATVRTGGKGTVRRKYKAVHRAHGSEDDKKLDGVLRKLNVQPLPAIEEVNMFRDDGVVLHFAKPRVRANLPARTTAISGVVQEKKLQELLPGIVQQIGPEQLSSLRQILESYKGDAKAADDDDDIAPDAIEAGDM